MKLAIVMFGNRISPRFDVAPKMRVYEIEGKKVLQRKEIFCAEWDVMDRVQRLKDLRVDVVVCGAIRNAICEIFIDNGTSVIPWIIGDAQYFLKKLLASREKLEVIQTAKRHALLKRQPPGSKFKEGGETYSMVKDGSLQSKKHLERSTSKLTFKKGGKYEHDNQNKKTSQNLA